MIQYWGEEEVGKWLENIGLGEYQEVFAKHEVCGNELLGLTREDLKVRFTISTVHWPAPFFFVFVYLFFAVDYLYVDLSLSVF